MFERFRNSKSADAAQIHVAIEYAAPHWVILILNPGAKEWVAVRSTTKMIRIQNEFGDEIKKQPAIETFASHEKAQEWVDNNIPKAGKLTRKSKDIEVFLARAALPVGTVVAA